MQRRGPNFISLAVFWILTIKFTICLDKPACESTVQVDVEGRGDGKCLKKSFHNTKIDHI